MLNSIDSVFLALAFLVPGYITSSVITMFIPATAASTDRNYIKYLTLSSINLAIWSWLIYLIFQQPYFNEHKIVTGFVWFAILFIFPAIMGLIIGRVVRNPSIKKLLSMPEIVIIPTVPTAWDFKFRNIAATGGAWVVATLKNDTTLAGYLGDESFASNDRGERDLYIQDIYTIDDKGNWEPAPGNDGVLIKGSEIAYIEFRK